MKRTTSTLYKIGAPGVTRTPDSQFRKLLLYPPELRGHAGFRFHDLRYTCASWLVMKGRSLKEIQELLWHREFTVGFYRFVLILC